MRLTVDSAGRDSDAVPPRRWPDAVAVDVRRSPADTDDARLPDSRAVPDDAVDPVDARLPDSRAVPDDAVDPDEARLPDSRVVVDADVVDDPDEARGMRSVWPG